MNIIRFLGVLIFSWFAWLPVSEAAYITMEMEAAATVEKDKAKIRLDVTNKGDEPAFNIKAAAEIGGKTLTGPFKDTLSVDGKYSWETETSVGFSKPGRYPVTIVLDYTDQNQYPFTAISIAYLHYKENVISRVVGEAGVAPIEDEGRLKVRVKNLEQAEKKVNVRLFMPKEFSSEALQKEATVQPGKEERVEFEIKNLGALPGSQYTVYAILEYEDDRNHYANAVSWVLDVQIRKSFVSLYRIPLMGAAVLLILAAVYFNLKRKRRSEF